MVCVGTDLETSPRRPIAAGRAPRRRLGHGRPPPARREPARRAEWPALVELAQRRRRVVAIGEAGFDLHYVHSPARRAGGRVPRADPARARARPRARHPLARRVGRHVPRARRRRRPGAHGVPLLHRRTRRSATRARPRHVPLVQRHRDVQERRRRARGRGDHCRSTACWSRPTRRSSRRFRTAGRTNEPAFVAVVGVALAAATGRDVGGSGRVDTIRGARHCCVCSYSTRVYAATRERRRTPG